MGPGTFNELVKGLIGIGIVIGLVIALVIWGLVWLSSHVSFMWN